MSSRSAAAPGSSRARSPAGAGREAEPWAWTRAPRSSPRRGASRLLDFRTGDAHALPFDAGSFDAAIAHTLISHAADPAAVLAEARRFLKPGGMLVVFDGDYASLTYAHRDGDTGHRMDWALARAAFNNPLVMRTLPRLLDDAGLHLCETTADVASEIGTGSYFRSMAEIYAPLIAEAGLAPAGEVDAWLSAQPWPTAAFSHRATTTPSSPSARWYSLRLSREGAA